MTTEQLAALYRDERFWLIPVATLAVSMGAFLLFAVPMTLLAARGHDTPLARRIQTRRPRAQELVWPSVKSWLVNNLAMAVVTIAAWPLLSRSGIHAGPLPGPLEVLLSVLAFVYLDDFLFYFMHRALHHRVLYRHIHAWHHRIVTPWAITGHYMHPLEYVLTGALALAGPVLFGCHVITLWVWIALRQWEAAEGHSGYDFRLSPTHYLPGGDGALHHDFHHARVKGNYAGFLRIWDAVFGTYAAGYAEARQKRGQR